MKVDEFLHPGQMTVEEVIAEVEAEHVTSLTPSGIECWYSWEPRRHYKLRWSPDPVWLEPDPVHNPGSLVDVRPTYTGMSEWREVPSVTTVLGVLDKPALVWWGQRIGVEGVIALVRDHGMDLPAGTFNTPPGFDPPYAEHIVSLLTQHRLTVNHQKDSAAKRGVNVHSAFEKWAEDQSYRPVVDTYPETEQGYIKGLISFLDDIFDVDGIKAEVMVGSIAHGFAGRYDLRLVIPTAREMTTRVYPKRAAKREQIPAGTYLLDLKTSKGIYPTHALQLAAYEMASVECGYGPTDHRAVVHVTADGKYELVLTHASPDDFLSVLSAHTTMSRSKGWT